MKDEERKPEEAGYKTPPKQHQYKKGESGNPRGRPKGSRNFRTEFEEVINAQIAVQQGGKRTRISRLRLLIHKLIEKGLMGDLKAIEKAFRLLMDFNLNAAASTNVVGAKLSELDEKIIADFLRRHQRSNKGE